MKDGRREGCFIIIVIIITIIIDIIIGEKEGMMDH